MNAPLPAHLLNDPRIWRGDSAFQSIHGNESTGHVGLDAVLPGGGWPSGAVSELVTDKPGCGELRILLPAIARLTQSGKHVLLINPPHIPYAPAWAAAGVDLNKLQWVRTLQSSDTLWAMEQALREPGCGAVIGWPDDTLNDRACRRLNLAAEQGGACGFVLREGSHAQIVSPFALRIGVRAGHGGVWLQVLKRRGTPLLQPVFIAHAHQPLPKQQPAFLATTTPNRHVVDCAPFPQAGHRVHAGAQFARAA
ncbi:translesion DNA synthesis-associated protein ImuA [Burkholderiaceae bacterium DAT-1]|nr:translesion DNA synthesis-associated protein ImuA [Burkholderiaceae bacterium DAT-1]